MNNLTFKSILLSSVLIAFQISEGLSSCPTGTTTSFEKVAGVTVRGLPLLPLYQSPTKGVPATAECHNRCRAQIKCRAFILNYDTQSCVGLDWEHSSNQGSTSSIISSSDKSSYFEKICLTSTPCERAWTFERVLGKELAGFDDKIIDRVPSRLACQELCLIEQQFTCKSGEYDYASQRCHLSREDRRSQPNSFRVAPISTDYFENQCASKIGLSSAASTTSAATSGVKGGPIGGTKSIPRGPTLGTGSLGGPSNCDYEKRDNLDLNRADLIRAAFSVEQCKALCDSMRAFLCRSFTFLAASAECALSSDDTTSAGGLRNLDTRVGATFYQKASCLDIGLLCEPSSMTVTLRSYEPFLGRIYSKREPGRCETVGRSTYDTSLTLGFGPDARCGVSEEAAGRYSGVVIIQHHPLIQRKGDQVVRLLCVFEAHNRTVSNAYNVLVSDTDHDAAMVNATAAPPNIRMRITDQYGNDVVGAKLGDQLYLRIELDSDDSVFGMIARDLIAKSGQTQESIVLLDNDGCPTDPSIFPALVKDPRSKALVSKFDAFKFAEDVVVRFQAHVQFCIDDCPMPDCDISSRYPHQTRIDGSGIDEQQRLESVTHSKEVLNGTKAASEATSNSHRRRRRTTEDDAGSRLSNSEFPLLQREIIVEGLSSGSKKAAGRKKGSEDGNKFTESERNLNEVGNMESSSHLSNGSPSLTASSSLICTSKGSLIMAFFTIIVAQLAIVITCVCLVVCCCNRKRSRTDETCAGRTGAFFGQQSHSAFNPSGKQSRTSNYNQRMPSSSVSSSSTSSLPSNSKNGSSVSLSSHANPSHSTSPWTSILEYNGRVPRVGYPSRP